MQGRTAVDARHGVIVALEVTREATARAQIAELDAESDSEGRSQP
jgi:hypothetical protein